MPEFNEHQQKLYLAINQTLSLLEDAGMSIADAIPVLERNLREAREAMNPPQS